MDINNNQLINTFTKGMNTDTSDAFIGADLYRYAENLRISTDTNSSGGTLVPIGGTVGIDSNICDWDNIIAVTSARDMLIVVGIKSVDNLTYMQVYEYNTTDKDLLDLSPKSWRKMIVENDVPHGMLLGNDSAVPSYVSTVVRWESDKNVKLYIADGTHTIMSIRLDKTTNLTTADAGTTSLDSLLLPPIVSFSNETGTINAAKVLYAYRFYIAGGNATTLSPLSEQLVFYKDLSHGYTITENSAKAVTIRIPPESIANVEANNSSVDSLEVYRISYLITGHQPKVDRIYSGPLLNGEITDRGGDDVPFTIEELMSFGQSLTRPHEIENKGGYLFLANLSYVKDGVDDKFKAIDTTAPSSGGNEAFKTYEWNPEHWKNPVNTEEWGGQGEYFKWEYIERTVTLAANNEIIDGDDITSLRRGEVYRYGVILYDEHGHESSPKFIADIMIPPESEPGFELVDEFNNGQTTLKRIGIKFSLVKSLSEFGVAGWLIVRCNRSYADKINVFQGIVGLPQRLYKDNRDNFEYWSDSVLTDTTHFSSLNSTAKLYPGGFMSMQYYKDAWNSIGNTTYSDPNILMFACPEFCYMLDDTDNLLKYMLQNIAFLPVLYYDIPIYNNNGLVSIGATSKTVSSFRWVNNAQMFGIPANRIKPSDDELWLEAWGPININPEKVVGFEDCTQIAYEDNEDMKLYIAFYHMQPTGKHVVDENTVLPNSSVEIDSYTPIFVSDDLYKSFSKNELLSYMSNEFSIKGDSFINWVTSGIDYSGYLGLTKDDIEQALTKTYSTLQKNASQFGFIFYDDAYKTPGIVRYAATGGKCLLFSAKDGQTFGYLSSKESTSNIFPICIGNIRNTHPVPYGGYSEQSKINSVYYANGNFTDGTELEVFDGDTYLCMFTYNAAHGFIDAKYWNIPKLGVVYTVPIESSINLRARSGYLYTDKTVHDTLDVFVLDHPVVIDLYDALTPYKLDDYAYIYNAAYDALPNVIKYIPIYYNSVLTNNYDTRIHYTVLKEDNLNIDVWLLTDSSSYFDVDSKFGAITNLRLFKDKLLFWQEHAVGLLTVDEKTVITNDKGSDIILADNSGVVRRYDYISTKYGMKKGQHTDAQSDNALYWWDSDNKELLLYSGNGLVPLTKAHMVENYINERQESVKPHVGYYGDFDEIFANVRRSDGNNGESLVFNEKLNAFTAVYKFDPIYSTSIGNALYLAKLGDVDHDAAMYRMSASDISSNTVLFDSPVYPLVQYVVNNQSSFVKVFDIQTFGGNFYGGGGHGERSTNQENVPELRNYPRVTLNGNDTSSLQPLTLSYTTPLRLSASVSGDRMTNREYDFRLDIPRNGDSQDWGDRLRGKTMQCTIKSDSNSKNFSLQYVITKYRMSWS